MVSRQQRNVAKKRELTPTVFVLKIEIKHASFFDSTKCLFTLRERDPFRECKWIENRLPRPKGVTPHKKKEKGWGVEGEEGF